MPRHRNLRGLGNDSCTTSRGNLVQSIYSGSIAYTMKDFFVNQHINLSGFWFDYFMILEPCVSMSQCLHVAVGFKEDDCSDRLFLPNQARN